MIVKIDKTICKHLSHISCYNNNYYQLPFEVNKCSILYEIYGGDESFGGYSTGILLDKYIPMYYLHQYENDDYFIIDSDKLNTENLWT